MISIEVTLRIALEAHTGQKDLDGNPAILHPLAVGLMGRTDAEIKTGFLHDVVEDSSITLVDLKNRGVEMRCSRHWHSCHTIRQKWDILSMWKHHSLWQCHRNSCQT